MVGEELDVVLGSEGLITEAVGLELGLSELTPDGAELIAILGSAVKKSS